MTHTSVTEAQKALLEMLGRAYDEDRAVRIAARTTWQSALDDEPTASRTVARGLVGHGLARYSEPDNLYLLITAAGKAVLNPRAAA